MGCRKFLKIRYFRPALGKQGHNIFYRFAAANLRHARLNGEGGRIVGITRLPVVDYRALTGKVILAKNQCHARQMGGDFRFHIGNNNLFLPGNRQATRLVKVRALSSILTPESAATVLLLAALQRSPADVRRHDKAPLHRS